MQDLINNFHNLKKFSFKSLPDVIFSITFFLKQRFIFK